MKRASLSSPALRSTALVGLLLAIAVSGPASLRGAQTRVKPGFNIFSEEQDVEIGRQSAAEVEHQLPLLTEQSLQDYVNAVGKRLTAQAPGAAYPYQFKIINVSDINAFALPGGFMYANRGLMEAAGDESELAGVLAHEIAHVALRHGTNQASKAYLAQAGFGLLGGLLGQGNATDIIGQLGGFGLNTLFLKFSRTAETQADIVGVQMLSGAGYDPLGMVRFFDKLHQQAGGDPGRLEQFFSSHPPPADRAERIRQEMRLLGTVSPTPPAADFQAIRAQLNALPPAPSMQQLAEGKDPRQEEIRVAPPSSRLIRFLQPEGIFEIAHPDNWAVSQSPDGFGVTIFPRGGIARMAGQRQQVVYGVIINRQAPSEGGVADDFRRGRRVEDRSLLRQETELAVHQILKANPHLEVVRDSLRREWIDGGPGLSLILSGPSPAKQHEEQVTLYTRLLPDRQLLYVLFVAPASAYPALGPTFGRMISSLRIDSNP